MYLSLSALVNDDDIHNLLIPIIFSDIGISSMVAVIYPTAMMLLIEN